MIKHSVIYIFISFFIYSCNSNTSKDIQCHVHDVERIIERFDNNVQSAINNGNFTYIKLVSKTTLDSCKIKLDKIKETKVPANQEDLKEASISYVIAIQEIVLAEEVYSNLTELTTSKEADSIDQNLINCSKKAKDKYEKYISLVNKTSN